MEADKEAFYELEFFLGRCLKKLQAMPKRRNNGKQ